MTKRGCLIGWVVVVASLAPRAVQAGAVLDWNSIALDVLRAEATHPPKVGRDLAIVHAAVFDAVNSVEGGYTPIVGLLSIPTGGVSLDAAVAACESHTNLYLDTTAALLDLGKDAWQRTVDRVGTERIVYGTDYPWASRESVERELALIHSLRLSPQEEEGILGDNLLNLWRTAVP